MNKEFMIIDNIPVAINGEKNLLELIRKAGIELPTFCYYSELSVYGACRMCMVENKWGGMEAACSTPPRNGMEIYTNTPRLRKYRKMILERKNSETNDDGMIEELDIRFSEITPELMDRYSLSTEAKGVVITEIRPGSDAEEKGLRTGDVVAKIDKKDVFTLADVRNYVNEAKMENNRPVLLLVQDKGIVHFAALKLKENK